MLKAFSKKNAVMLCMISSAVLTVTSCKKEHVYIEDSIYKNLDSLSYMLFNYSNCNNKHGEFVIQSFEDFNFTDSTCNLTGNFSLQFDSFTYVGASISLNHLGYDTYLNIYEDKSKNKIIVRLQANERYEMVSPSLANKWYWFKIKRIEDSYSISFVREYNLYSNP